MNFFPKTPRVKTILLKIMVTLTKNKTDIANQFNNYFTSIGLSTAQHFHYTGDKYYSYYLNEQIHSGFV